MRVGYCAMRASDYRKCLDAAREYERESFFESPDVGFKPWFLETKLAAITWQRKEAIRKLGAAPSVADRPVKPVPSRGHPGHVRDRVCHSHVEHPEESG